MKRRTLALVVLLMAAAAPVAAETAYLYAGASYQPSSFGSEEQVSAGFEAEAGLVLVDAAVQLGEVDLGGASSGTVSGRLDAYGTVRLGGSKRWLLGAGVAFEWTIIEELRFGDYAAGAGLVHPAAVFGFTSERWHLRLAYEAPDSEIDLQAVTGVVRWTRFRLKRYLPGGRVRARYIIEDDLGRSGWQAEVDVLAVKFGG